VYRSVYLQALAAAMDYVHRGTDVSAAHQCSTPVVKLDHAF